MKITITGEKLQSALKAQLARVADKRAKYEAYVEQHTALHGRSPNGSKMCALEMQAQYIYTGMEGYVRKMEAAIAAIDPQEQYRIGMTKYLTAYVNGPYDAVTIPIDPSDESGLQGLDFN